MALLCVVVCAAVLLSLLRLWDLAHTVPTYKPGISTTTGTRVRASTPRRSPACSLSGMILSYQVPGTLAQHYRVRGTATLSGSVVACACARVLVRIHQVSCMPMCNAHAVRKMNALYFLLYRDTAVPVAYSSTRSQLSYCTFIVSYIRSFHKFAINSSLQEHLQEQPQNTVHLGCAAATQQRAADNQLQTAD